MSRFAAAENVINNYLAGLPRELPEEFHQLAQAILTVTREQRSFGLQLQLLPLKEFTLAKAQRFYSALATSSTPFMLPELTTATVDHYRVVLQLVKEYVKHRRQLHGDTDYIRTIIVNLTPHDSAVDLALDPPASLADWQVTFVQTYWPQLVALVQAQLRSLPQDAFQGTSDHFIKQTIINRVPALTVEVLTAQLQPSLPAEATLCSRLIRVAVYHCYQAYRTNLIRDVVLQQLARALVTPELLSPVDKTADVFTTPLGQWFLTGTLQVLTTDGEVDLTATQRLQRQVFAWVNEYAQAELENWPEVFQPRELLLNMLRQLRRLVLAQIDDIATVDCLTQLQMEEEQHNQITLIYQSIEATATGDNRTVAAYLVDRLLYRYKHAVRRRCKSLYQRYLRPAKVPPALTGFDDFIYRHLQALITEQQLQEDLPAEPQFYKLLITQCADGRRRNRIIYALEQLRPALIASCQAWLDVHPLMEVIHDIWMTLVPACELKIRERLHQNFPLSPAMKVLKLGNSPIRPYFTYATTPLDANSDHLLPHLLSHVTTLCCYRIYAHVQRYVRAQLLPPAVALLNQPDPLFLRNREPVFSRANFSLAASEQGGSGIYQLDLGAHTFQLRFVTVPRQSCYQEYTFTSRQLDTLDFTRWEALAPTVVTTGKTWRLHIPLRYTHYLTPITPLSGTNSGVTKPTAELRIGIDQGITHLATVSAHEVTLSYHTTITEQGVKLTKQIMQGATRSATAEFESFKLVSERGHWFIDDREALYGHFAPDRLHFTYTPENEQKIATHSFGYGELRHLRHAIGMKQRQIAHYEAKTTFNAAHPTYGFLKEQLRRLHERVNRILTTLARMAAVKTSQLIFALHHAHPTLPVRVLVEDLRWSRHSARQQVGYFLAHNQVLFMHRQYQHFLAHYLRPAGIGVWRVSARYTSQTCALCGCLDATQRQGAAFCCRNLAHVVSSPSPLTPVPQVHRYTTQSDLNASRNIAFARPLTLTPLLA